MLCPTSAVVSTQIDRVCVRQSQEKETTQIWTTLWPRCQSNDRKCLLSSPFGKIRRTRALDLYKSIQTPCSTHNFTILNQLNALFLFIRITSFMSLIGDACKISVGTTARITFRYGFRQFGSIEISFHLPNDSALLSSCVFSVRVSLFAAIIVWRCFCAGNDAHRFNLLPPLTPPIPIPPTPPPTPPPPFGARILRTLVVPCISLCETERWTFKNIFKPKRKIQTR